MQWPARMVASGRRMSAGRAYLHARHAVAHLDPAQPAHWWGLCSLLSRHQLRHDLLRPTPEVWSELLPFLLLPDERVAERAMEEYLLYLEDPRLVDKQHLGIVINEALEGAVRWNESVAAVVEQPALALSAPWMALLSYQSILRVRHAVALYGGEWAHTRRASYWHGLPAFDAASIRTAAGHAVIALGAEPGDSPARHRALPTPRMAAAVRRFFPTVPASLS